MNILASMPRRLSRANPDTAVANAKTSSGHTCPFHGKPTKRASCRLCNAAYQRQYLQRRRTNAPAKEMWRRSRERARQLGIEFDIPDDLIIPALCPVLGLTLTAGGRRSSTSPSIDRVDPALGYVTGNVRIISDRANRLKSNRSVEDLRALAITGKVDLRTEYTKVANYVERENLLKEVRRRGQRGRNDSQHWREIEGFLDSQFADFGHRAQSGTDAVPSVSP